ncbi:MAG: hypothetical protein D6712_18875 [Chloroflexi bacterium]|nr:MAG: hypothetical protein D6712_18875 [Chloroflexota bacterium]
MSAPEPVAPTLKSATNVPALSARRAHVAVPLVLIVTELIVLALMLPPEGAAKEGLGIVTVAKAVVAVPPVAGWVPS